MTMDGRTILAVGACTVGLAVMSNCGILPESEPSADPEASVFNYDLERTRRLLRIPFSEWSPEDKQFVRQTGEQHLTQLSSGGMFNAEVSDLYIKYQEHTALGVTTEQANDIAKHLVLELPDEFRSHVASTSADPKRWKIVLKPPVAGVAWTIGCDDWEGLLVELGRIWTTAMHEANRQVGVEPEDSGAYFIDVLAGSQHLGQWSKPMGPTVPRRFDCE